jgi:PKD repeat protein
VRNAGTQSAFEARVGSLRCCIIVAAALVAGCGEDLMLPTGGAGGPTAIRVVDGDGQTGKIGELLSQPVVVKVTGAGDEPVENATVVFDFVSAGDGGAITPDTTVTDSSGTAQAQVLLGDKVGAQTGEARVVISGSSALQTSFIALATASGPGNHPPHAAFASHCDNLSCQFSQASTDDDGQVTGWSWQFGDNGTSTEAEPVHVYSAAGSYTVTLTVTDNDGATDATSARIDVSAPSPPPASNNPPHADFDTHCHDLNCQFSDKSKDDDGRVVSWFWQFGDGFVSVEQNPAHTYRDQGHYDVTLTVTDDDGAMNSKTERADAKD